MDQRPWWREPLLIAHLIPPDAEAMAQRDMAALAKTTADLGFNAVHYVAEDVSEGSSGIFFFNTSAAGEVRADLLGPYCREAHARGLRVIVYFNVHWLGAPLTSRHPDWAQRSAGGEPVPTAYGVGHYACVNSPWRDWSFQVIRDLAAYDIEGVFLDGPFFAQGACYCDACRAGFEAAVPRFGDRSDPAWGPFVNFRFESIARYLRDARDTLKSVKPQAILYMNGAGLEATWMLARDNRRLVEFQDLLGAEGGFLYHDLRRTPLWKASATAKLLETQAGGRPTVVFIDAHHAPWSRYFLSAPELRLLHFSALANGANTWYGVYESLADEAAATTAREVNALVRRHADVYRESESAANIALLWSGSTMCVYAAEDSDPGAAGDPMRGSFTDAFHGWYEVLLRSHLPFDVLDEPALTPERLARLELVILPNCGCLPAPAVEALRRWVSDGGSLIATYTTSLYEPNGERRADFALADVFGVQFAGRFIGPLPHDHLPVDPEHLLFQGIGQPFIPAPSQGVAVQATTARPVVHFLEPQRSRYQELPPQSPHPAILLNRFGEGKVLYLAGAFDAAYHLFSLPEHQALLANATRRLADPILTLLGAPESVEVSLRRQPAQSRLLVHLVNYTGEMTRPLRRVLAARDLRIGLRRVPRVRRATGLVHRQELGWHRADEGIAITLPFLGEYEVVVVDL